MTYQDRIKNIEKIINWISPLDGYFIWFKFDDKNNFEILYLTQDEIECNNLVLWIHPNAAAQLFGKNEQVYLYYDDGLLDYHYELTTNRTDYFVYHEKPIDMDQVRKELADLLKLLK